jgi:hypothetical protein
VLLTQALLAAAFVAMPQQTPGDRLYGRVETVRGEVHVGFIRWGRSAGAWADQLIGVKEISEENQLQVRRLKAEAEPQGDRAARSIVYNGVLITWDEDDTEIVPDTAESGVRFGHVRRVTRMDERVARVELRSLDAVELSSVNRRAPFVDTILVEAPDGGLVRVGWGDVTVVEFAAAPASSPPGSARLHGTATLRSGDSYTGYLTFDTRRIFTTDSLSGTRGDEDWSAPFSTIESLLVEEGSGFRLRVVGGETVALSSLRGGTLRILDPTLGGVQLSLNSRLQEIRFHPPTAPATPDTFEPEQRLRGTVTTRDGDRYHGFIRWDNDESGSWEILNGSEAGVTFTIELAKVSRIASDARRRAAVTLRDGRELLLSNSNDVGPGNKGVVIELDGGTFRFVDWLHLDALELEGR